MGFTDFFGEITGFGGSGNPATHNIDDDAYATIYNSALEDLNGMNAGTKAERDSIQNALRGQIADLENNAAGRKANFAEDMSRSFAADTQNRARSAGGTGNLAQVLSSPGSNYDAQARGLSRGYNDLYSQATNDLGSLQGIQGNLFNQDAAKADATSALKMGRINQRLGISLQNAENDFNSEQAGRERRLNTLSGLTKIGGGMFGGGGGGKS